MQGCVLFSSLLNLYIEQIFRDVGVMKGVTAGGANMKNLRYADDTALLTCNEEDLVTTVSDKEKPYGMEMNVMKTITMVISRSNTKNQHLNRRRAHRARSAFISLYKVLTSREVSLDTRIRLSKCYIWSTLLYGCETWTL